MILQISNYQDYCDYAHICPVCNEVLHEERFDYMDGNSMADDTRMAGHMPGCDGSIYDPISFKVTKTQEDLDEEAEQQRLFQREQYENHWR